MSNVQVQLGGQRVHAQVQSSGFARANAAVTAAAASQAAALASQVAAAASAAAADADAIATAADRVQTGLDAVATAADRVQTGLDVVATGADAVSTAADALATAADAVQTGLDRVATAADAIATAADRVQTGLDAVATAADRVQTGLDRTAAATSASDAAATLAASALKASNLSDLASASTARTNLGLGSIATQAASNVAITGGSVAGIVDLALADGGTGASTASVARDNLGLTIGANVQAYDPDLAAIAALTSAANKGLHATGSGTWALHDQTAFARTILDDADAATARDTLGVPAYGTKALAAAATIVAEVKSLQTLAYATASVGGGARYVRTSYATITAAAYPASAYFRSVDRFMPDGSTDATNGGYWLISEPFFCPEMFGAVGDDTTIDTTPWRDMVATSPEGGVVRFRVGGRYRIDDDIVLDKPISIYGGGSGTYDGQLGTFIRQVTPGENVFTLKARLANYLYGQYALVGCLFDSINFLGAAAGGIQLPANRAAAAIGSDTTVNAGDYHLRENDVRNCVIQNFTRPLDLEGIVYLWDFYSVKWRFCTEALTISQGASPQVGGQLRFFGCSGTQCDDYILSVFMDTMGGSLSLFGCTISESLGGVKINEELTLVMSGCEVESHIDGGDGVGLYIPITDAVNPNSSAPKIITGCKFLTNDVDIWIDKTTSAFSGGTFAWPMTMDANYFSAPEALRITVPGGHAGIISQAFVLGNSNAGTNNGQVADSQISANFGGVDERKFDYARMRVLSTGLPVVYSGAAGSAPVLATATVPNGSTLYLEDVERFSMNATTNVRGSCSLDAVDSTGTPVIAAFGNGYVASLTWLNSTGSSQEIRLTAGDGGSGNPYYVRAMIRVA